MNNKLIFWSITVGLGGFLFGLDTAVISGAEQDIQQLWQLTKLQHGLAIAMALYGTVFGAAFGGIPADKYGRKKTLLWIGILFFVSAIGAALAPEVNSFMFFRFIGGLSIGASSVVAPVYISEIAPPQYRGRMGISFQFNIVLGIVMAYLSNYLLEGGDNDWRLMLGVVALPSLLFSVMMLLVPETPRWLMLFKNDPAAARAVIALTTPSVSATEKELDNIKNLESDDLAIEKELDNIKNSESGAATGVRESFFGGKYQLPIVLAFLFAFFNQASGINAVIYFAPRIFEMTGLGKEGALLSTTGVGVVNLIFTVLGWSLIDRFGRRTLMYIGSVGYIVSLALITLAFFNQSYAGVPIFVFAFIAAHAIGQGSVIWVFISEIFPNSVRASGMALGSLTHWVFAALLTQFFPLLADRFGGAPIFAFFTFMMCFQLLYVWRMMPETRGVSLEDLQKKLTKS